MSNSGRRRKAPQAETRRQVHNGDGTAMTDQAAMRIARAMRVSPDPSHRGSVPSPAKFRLGEWRDVLTRKG